MGTVWAFSCVVVTQILVFSSVLQIESVTSKTSQDDSYFFELSTFGPVSDEPALEPAFTPISPSFSTPPPSSHNESSINSGHKADGKQNGKQGDSKHNTGNQADIGSTVIIVCASLMFLLVVLLGCLLHRRRVRNSWEFGKMTDEIALASSSAKVAALSDGFKPVSWAEKTAKGGHIEGHCVYVSSVNDPLPSSRSEPRASGQPRYSNAESNQRCDMESLDVHLPPLSRKPKSDKLAQSVDEEPFCSSRRPSNVSRTSSSSPSEPPIAQSTLNPKSQHSNFFSRKQEKGCAASSPSTENLELEFGKSILGPPKPLQPNPPPLPARPSSRHLSSTSGKLSVTGSVSSGNPPPPPPPHKPKGAPDIPLPPPPSRPFRPHSALRSSENPDEQAGPGCADQSKKPKLKPLHWDKVRANAERSMVWHHLKSGSFQLNEEMIEALFLYNTPATLKDDPSKRSSPPQNLRLLDLRKSQNIAILLRALNMTKEEVCEALLDGTYDSIGIEFLEAISKMAPTRDEEFRLKEYKGDVSNLGSSERFLKALLEIPFAFKRIDAMLYKANFEEELAFIKTSLSTLEAACEELRSNRLFLKLLEAVLKTGNRMNVGTKRGDAQAFKLDTLLKLVDVKGRDGKTTLLHFVVLEIIKAEGARALRNTNQAEDVETISQNDRDEEYKKLGLQVVASLGTELSNVKKVAGMDSDILSSSVTNLAKGLVKVKGILQMIREAKGNEGDTEGNFFRSMTIFVEKAMTDIPHIQGQETKAFARLKETTEYFHGDAAKQEACSLRIFIVVRDFLSTLDKVCREIAKTEIESKGSLPGQSTSESVIIYPISMPIFPRSKERKHEGSEDERSGT